MKKVLVTGATGLIGKELIKPLAETGFEIYAITNQLDNRFDGVNWYYGDLFETSFIEETMKKIKPQYLINLAWITTGDYYFSDKNYQFLNAGVNLIRAFKENGGKRAIYAGSYFEYKFKDTPIKETDEINSMEDSYAFCKNKLREIVEFYCKINNISFGYGRIFNVYGRNEASSRLMGMLINNLSNNKEVVIKTPYLYKDYIYAKDIANAVVKFLNSTTEGVVNICSGKPVQIGEFAKIVAKKLNKEHLLIFANEKTSQPTFIVGDNTRLKNEIKYDLLYSIEKGVEDILLDINS